MEVGWLINKDDSILQMKILGMNVTLSQLRIDRHGNIIILNVTFELFTFCKLLCCLNYEILRT